jgi:hypothetical protein
MIAAAQSITAFSLARGTGAVNDEEVCLRSQTSGTRFEFLDRRAGGHIY